MERLRQKIQRIIRERKLYFAILSYFLLFDFLVLGMGILIYHNAAEDARKEAKIQLRAWEGQYAAALDEQYQNLYGAGQNLLNHFYIKRYWRIYEEADISEKIEMFQIPAILEETKKLMSAVDTIFLYNASEKGFTEEGMVSKDMYYNRIYIYDGVPAQEWDGLLDAPHSVRILPITVVQCPYSTGSTKEILPIVTSRYVNGLKTVVVINVNMKIFTAELRGICEAQRMGYILKNEEGTVQSAYRWEENYTAAEPVRMGNGWTLTFGMPEEEYMKGSNEILFFTGCMCLFIVILSFLMSFVFSYVLYNPLHYLQNTMDKVRRKMRHPAGSMDGQNKRALKKLQEDVERITEDYTQLLDEYSADMESSVLLYCLYSKLEQSEEAFEKSFANRYNFKSDVLQCFILQFEFTERFEEQKEIEKRRLMKAVQMLVESVFYSVAPIGIVGHGELGFLVLVNAEEEERCGRCITQILEILRNDEQWFIPYIGVSRVQTLCELQEAYDEARTGLEYAMYRRISSSPQFGEAPLRTQIKYHPSEEAQLLGQLQQGDLPGLKKTLEVLLDQSVQKNYSWRGCRQLFERLYRTASISLSATLSVQLPIDLLNCNILQMQEILMERFRMLLQSTNNMTVNTDNQMITAVCDYIAAHYQENISLGAIAEHMGYSSKYMSKLFKESMNWNLSDYINYVRIEKAKELLSETTETMERIQEMVGIPSRTTFLRVFKKFEGITPGQYRKLRQNSVLG